MSFIRPRLEVLEPREMLDANNPLASAGEALRNDAARLGNDMATADYTLVNMVKSPQTNETPAAQLGQLYRMGSELVADWVRMDQAVVQYEIAVEVTEFQTLQTWLADISGFLTSMALSLSPSAADSGAGNGNPGNGTGSGGNPGNGGVHPPSPSPSPSVHDPLYVLDENTGETIPVNSTLSTFSTWRENYLAQASGNSSTTFQWSTNQAPDATNISGQNTANLQWSWSNFTGPARTETITATATPQGGQPITQTMTFVVSGTNSPAFSSSRPTSSSTWQSVITPDQLNGGQATQAAGPYASIGEDDGSVQTSFSMPSYNPNASPVSLDYNSTTANAQPIFLTAYQLPLGQTVPSTITAQLTFNGTPLTTLTYNTANLTTGDIVQIALQANATTLTTGRYPWSITVTNNSTPTTYNGNVNIVNQASSPFGAGWSLDNVEQLLPVTGGVILVEPGGTSLWFASNGQGNFTTPAGDFSTLVQNQDGSYTRTFTDGSKNNFNSSGQQTSTVDRDGNTTTFGYTSGQLTSITDMNGQVTTLAYSSGLLSSITDPANRTATLSYTGKQLTSITDPGSDVWQYTYDSANDMTALTDPNNHATTFTYDFADRVSSVTQPDSSTLQLTAVQTNGLAAPGTGTASNPAESVLLAVGDQALFTDGNGKLWTTGVDWLGYGSDVADIDPLGDASLNYINASGLTWLSTDAMGRRTREFYDSNGNPTEIVNPGDTYSQYQYNSFNEPTKYTNEIGSIYTYAYNSKGDLTQETNALNETTTYAYNTAGLETSMTNADNNTWTYSYDTLNRKIGETDPLKYTQSWVYDNASHLTQYTDQNGNVSTYAYNPMGWMTSETLPDTSGVTSTYTFTYDNVGNQTSETTPITSSLTATTYDTYDPMNRLSTETDPLGDLTKYTYDNNGNQIAVTNPLGYTTSYAYNTANWETSETTPISGSPPNQVTATTTYGYDADGEQTSVTDPLGDITKTTYNSRGWVASTTDPTNDQTTYGYDSVGDQTTETQTSGSTIYTITTAYNADGVKVTSICAPPGGYVTGLVSGEVSGNLSGSWTGGYGQSVSGSFSGTVVGTLTTPAGDAIVSGTVKGTLSGSESSTGVLTGSYTGTGALTISGALSGTMKLTISGATDNNTTNPENPTSGTLSGGIDASMTGQINNLGQVTDPSVDGSGIVQFDLPSSQGFGTASGSFSGQEVGPSTNYKYDAVGNLLSQTGPGTCSGNSMSLG